MDLRGLLAVLDRLEAGDLRTVAVDTREPSPFCHEILNANPYAFLDDAPLEERRTRAVAMRRSLDPAEAAHMGALDAEAIARVAEESWPLVRDADELHDALLTLILLPPVEGWQGLFEELARDRRVSILSQAAAGLARAPATYWVAAERLEAARRAVEQLATDAVLTVLRGWTDSIGPVTPSGLAGRLSLPVEAIESALAQLEAEGTILRGRFAAPCEQLGETEYCHRRILARIHRMTLARLRREIEPVTSAQFMRFLCRWQHVAPAAQLHGADGLLQILRQLEGCEIPAAAWESQVLPRRVAQYDPELLDQLCLSGEVMWGRLSPHPAWKIEAGSEGGRRVRPTRVAPLAIFLRESAAQLLPPRPTTPPALSHAARDVLTALETRGASFFADLQRSTGRLASEVEDGLWELVAGGLVTADGFENLRALIDPKRRSGEGRGRTRRPRHAAGRWALLERSSTPAVAAQVSVEFFATQLLNRWGVVFRDLAAQETLAPPWRDLLQVLRRMEARGEIRGGRFVAGFVGEQFARPEALDLLRHLRRGWQAGADQAASREEIEIAAADPLNLTGVVLPGPRTATRGQGWVRLIDGVALDVVPDDVAAAAVI
jgi:ATP-dependent Lhr-like helicase